MYPITSQKKLLELLKKHHFFTQKKLGQNFLLCDTTLEDIVEQSEITENDTVIEIGPGPGALTQKILAQNPKKLIAIEYDSKIIPVLKESTGNPENLEIRNEDALSYKIHTENTIVTANIPYYLTSPLLTHFLSQKLPPKRIVLLVQKEVAEKICDKENSVLSLLVSLYAESKLLFFVSKNKFFPEPKVDSAVILLTPHKKNLLSDDISPIFWKIVHQSFSQKRKKLKNTLQSLFFPYEKDLETLFKKIEISLDRRPQTLSIEEFIKISRLFLEISQKK
jgi:16S rRNA (adenine1518-N6/adenine1519-N6)-dimethyltransferase